MSDLAADVALAFVVVRAAARLAAWAGLAPGDNESAGKRKKVGMRSGSACLYAGESVYQAVRD